MRSLKRNRVVCRSFWKKAPKAGSLLLACITLLITNAFGFDDFITRDGDQLKDGDKVFRFIAVNAPSINGQYDGYKFTRPASGYAYDPMELSFEMEAYFKDMAQMGVTVLRTWGITVEKGLGEYEALVDGPYSYNEVAFRRIDKMLELCNKYNMRVLLCLVKENKPWGDTKDFAALYGGGDYYATPAVKDGFKHLVKTFINRKNHYTGIRYKDDKAILAWEFGNEVPNDKGAWIGEMAEYTKSLDPNHLIADPRRGRNLEEMNAIVEDVIQNGWKVDIVRTRQYPNFKQSVSQFWDICEGKLPMIIDEFQREEGFEEVLQEICATGTSGGLLWSLMKHPYDGGLGSHALFHSYSWGGSRWPGFDSGDYFNESEHLRLIREYGYKIRGLEAPPVPAPEDAPYLYESLRGDAAALKWRVSPGSRYYIVERATSPEGPWTNISGDLDISYHLYYYPLFSDSTAGAGSGTSGPGTADAAGAGTSTGAGAASLRRSGYSGPAEAAYYYRVTGKNESGQSPPSNVIGPVRRRVKMLMDNLAGFSLSWSHSENLRISTETWPRLRQTEEDFYQVERVPGSGSGELVYRADAIKWVEVFVFSDSIESIGIQYSVDGSNWKALPDGSIVLTHRPAYPSELSGRENNPVDKYIYRVPALPQGASYVKILTGNANADSSFPWIGRVHLGYTGSLKNQ